MELVNFSQEVKDQLYKLATISLCPNLAGQVTMASMLRRAGLQLRAFPPRHHAHCLARSGAEPHAGMRSTSLCSFVIVRVCHEIIAPRPSGPGPPPIPPHPPTHPHPHPHHPLTLTPTHTPPPPLPGTGDEAASAGRPFLPAL